MNKTEALERLDAIELQAAELRRTINAPDLAPSLLTKPKPGSGDEYYGLDGYSTAPMGARMYLARETRMDKYSHGNIFQSKELAASYAEAIETMLLLRHQLGTVPAGQWAQWMVEASQDCATMVVRCVARTDMLSKIGKVSPCFSTERAARDAIDTIGPARILRMFKTFHHVTD